MQLPFKIARRYLFARKSTNAINIITGISVFGLTIGTAALILVLSVFNGFQDLLLTLFSNFNPPIKVTPVQGKTFSPDSISLDEIFQLEAIQYVSQTLEETTLFEFEDTQQFGTIKGVDSIFHKVTAIDSTIREGTYNLQRDVISFGVFGTGMANKLGVEVGDAFNAVNVYMPRKRKSAIGQPFRKQFLHPGGTFFFQREYDSEYVITNLAFVQRLIGGEKKISALEIKLQPDADMEQAKQQLAAILGDGFRIKDRYQQDEAFLKIMNMEKWISFAILSLALLLVAFNMIGALWMIVLEKKRDISILKSMGMQDVTVRNIFLYEGGLMCLLGLGAGFVFSLIFYAAQKYLGLIPIPEGFVVDAYPISIKLADFVAVSLAVLFIGMLASIPAALRAQRIQALIREE